MLFFSLVPRLLTLTVAVSLCLLDTGCYFVREEEKNNKNWPQKKKHPISSGAGFVYLLEEEATVLPEPSPSFEACLGSRVNPTPQAPLAFVFFQTPLLSSPLVGDLANLLFKAQVALIQFSEEAPLGLLETCLATGGLPGAWLHPESTSEGGAPFPDFKAFEIVVFSPSETAETLSQKLLAQLFQKKSFVSH